MEMPKLNIKEFGLRVPGRGCALPRCTRASHETCITKPCYTVNKTVIRYGEKVFGNTVNSTNKCLVETAT